MRKNLLVLAIGLAFILPGITQAVPLTFITTLSGANERPPASTPGLGVATVTLNDTEDMFSYAISFENLLTAATVAHIHFGLITSTGPVIFDFTSLLPKATAGSFSGTLVATDLIPRPAVGINTFPDAVNAFKQGNTYVNIHTTTFPAGEIRGQLVLEPATGLLFSAGLVGLLLAGRRQHI